MKASNGEVAGQTRRRDAVRLLKSVLDAAVDSGLILRNPARTKSGKTPYMPSRSKTKPHRYLNDEQVARLADVAGDQAGRLIRIAAYTGPRWGELTALTVSDVDVLRGRLHIRRAYTRLDSGQLLLGDTKTHANRYVVVPIPLRGLLQAQLADKGPHDLLFSQGDGKALRRENFTSRHLSTAVETAGTAVRTLQALLCLPERQQTGVYGSSTTQAVRALQERSGIPVTGLVDATTWTHIELADRSARSDLTQGEKVKRTNMFKRLRRCTLAEGAEDFEPLTFHDLRHTAASLAIRVGATVKAVQEMLGHASAQETLNTYAGLFPDEQDAVADRLAANIVAPSAHYVPTGDGHQHEEAPTERRLQAV
ncbi:tyrosine-type recombinase/integrase [Georgenia thermotolerans]|uniref:Tyrosine-type recombinase/integrase n=1 Tax=Georgenia thermotolerans TaxID=527326 RepID=A0A7J5UMB4_9MICO|nr:tyrosine-type recombinase/integrase [Georgenia thermotolerans]KAE8763519.1 tyrosine-type recombinase/integrase [Georgenia thermotolerans]